MEGGRVKGGVSEGRVKGGVSGVREVKGGVSGGREGEGRSEWKEGG